MKGWTIVIDIVSVIFLVLCCYLWWKTLQSAEAERELQLRVLMADRPPPRPPRPKASRRKDPAHD